MFQGFVALEGTIELVLLTKDGSETPTNADALPTFRVYSANGFVKEGTAAFLDSGSVTNATNATPIVITSAMHGLTTGARVTITGVGGNTAANGTFVITKIDNNSFSLDGSVGNGAYTTGGTWNVTGAYSMSVPATAANGYAAGENYVAVATYAVGGTQMGQHESFVVT